MRLVEAGADGDGRSTDVMEIAKPDDLRDIASLGLSLAEAKQLQADPTAARRLAPRLDVPEPGRRDCLMFGGGTDRR